MPQLIEGKHLAQPLLAEVKRKVLALEKKHIRPRLSVVIVGDDPSSSIYVERKKRKAEQCGIDSEIIRLDASVAEDKLLETVQGLSDSPEINGILVQLPLPPHIDVEKVISAIAPNKDVDCFHPINVGKLATCYPSPVEQLLPCTPAGCMDIITHTGISLPGTHALVIGASNIVGKPMAIMLMNVGCTVTVANRRTRNLGELCLASEIIITATGKVGLITPEITPEGCVLIDVGITRLEDGSIAGDASPLCHDKAAFSTPVPGGVGVTTIAYLMRNTITACCLQHNIRHDQL